VKPDDDTDHGPVYAADGPVDDAADRLRRRVLWRMPTGLYLLGSRAGERLNLMTLSWAMQVAMDPKLVAVSVETTALTHELISESRVFAVSILRRDDRAIVRKFVKPVQATDVHLDPSGFGTIRDLAVRTDRTGAPVLLNAAAFLDCTLTETLALGSHSLFVGEVLGFGFGEAGEDAPVLRVEDTRMNYGG
jgi:flavin reductase (DIM6/NTAB) family NADH-FMN oxidoreductase RutF